MIRAVVVEDEPLARQYLCTLLEETGKVEVVGEADDGRAGLRLCAERAPDAAFLDIRIPGPDGLSLAGRLLTLARPPLVVFVTGFSGHAVAAFSVEAVDYLLKPIELGAVLEPVRRVSHRLAVGARIRRVGRRRARGSPRRQGRERGERQAPPPRRHRRGAAPAPAHLDPHRGRGIPDLLPAGDARALARRVALPADLPRRDRQHDRRGRSPGSGTGATNSGSWTAPARSRNPRGPGRPSWPTTSGPAVLADDRPRRFGPDFRPFGQSPPMRRRTALS